MPDSLYAELRTFTERLTAHLAEITFDPADAGSIAAALRRARAVMAREAWPMRHNQDVEEVCRLMHDEITNWLLAYGEAVGMSRFELFALRRTVLWFLPYRAEHDPGLLRSSEIPLYGLIDGRWQNQLLEEKLTDKVLLYKLLSLSKSKDH